MDERDLLKDLWEDSYDVYDEGAHDSITGRAAAEITQLRAELASLSAENERLRDALKRIGERKSLGGEGWQSEATRMAITAKEALK